MLLNPRVFVTSALKNSRKMSVFIQKLNPITGINDWIVQQEDYDYHQEVARASFADMLHDTERNKKYELALKSAIEKMHSLGKKANVLDIGTGTGLLSMMAVRHGADTVTACEAFEPMGECALKVIKRNGLSDKIRIIPKRSTELTVGPSGDLQTKCNILVTEVFDTELIGEGALSTFSHAHEVLLEKDCIVVPQSATVYAQIVESPFVQTWNKVKDIYDNDGKLLIQVPPWVKNCAGSAAVHDLQLNQLKLELVKFITPPIPVFRFDWSGRTPFIFKQSTIHTVKAECGGVAQAVFMWWDLQMDTENKVVLSCAPYWAHPTGVDLPWRDHWMQAVYYLPQENFVEKGKEINLMSSHDEYSLWFHVKLDLKLTEDCYQSPICTCCLHQSFSRTRIGQINDATRNKKYIRLLEKHVDENSVILVLSDGFYLSLCACKLGAKKIYYVERNDFSGKILRDFITFNNFTNVEVFENIEALKSSDIEKITMVFGEPYFSTSILPWDNLLFLYLLRNVRDLLTDDAKVFPQSCTIRGIAVRFDDLNKIRLPLGECEGFLMKDFDDLIESSSTISDDNVEAQPLWEYPGVALSKMIDVVTINTNNIKSNFNTSGVIDIEKKFGACNGVALWIDWVHEDGIVISSGPTSPVELGKPISWDVYTRQGVCLFPEKETCQIKYQFIFDFEKGDIIWRNE